MIVKLDSQGSVSAVDPLPSVTLVQLPFPSQTSPLASLVDYYAEYNRQYALVFPEYATQSGDLWEAPLWVAHLDGAIGSDLTRFLDLSRAPFDAEACIAAIVEAAPPEALLFLSPLAQNFSLATHVSRGLRGRGYRTVLGGNMSELGSPEDFSRVYSGILDRGVYARLVSQPDTVIVTKTKWGKQPDSLGYVPRYRLLRAFSKRVPLIRLNASHGCLLACSFCGDAWSRQLHVVDRELLGTELSELRRTFPDTKLVYIGDKTFGQSPEAVQNLLSLIRPEYGLRLIVQTHVSVITPELIAAMQQLGVEVVEIGFETASSAMLRELHKYGGAEPYRRAIEALHAGGLRVILNVLGGLPNETGETHARTLEFLDATAESVWLYNLYNFVPYPKTPLFATLKPRIMDWDFQNWREDQPVVFEPYHQSREASWTQFLALVERATSLIQRRAREPHPSAPLCGTGSRLGTMSAEGES